MFRQFGEIFLLAWGVAFQGANSDILWAGCLASLITVFREAGPFMVFGRQGLMVPATDVLLQCAEVLNVSFAKCGGDVRRGKARDTGG